MKITLPLVTFVLYAAAPAFAIPVSVTVVGPDNKPLAGAKLNVAQGGMFDGRMNDARPQSGADGVFTWNWDGGFKTANAAITPQTIEEMRALIEANAAAKTGSYLRVKASAPGMVAETRVIKAGQTTIMLQPARAWSGFVLDQNQKPVAGATLKLEAVRPLGANKNPSAFDRYLDPMLSVDDLLASTDAAGRWTFLGMPALGSAELSIDAPQFAALKSSVLIGEGDAAPIVFKQAAQITGVLLAPDGKPIVGQTVRVNYDVKNQATTDEQGRFVIKGISPGDVTLSFNVPNVRETKAATPPDFVFQSARPFRVEAGKTTDLGEIRASAGLLVKARIVSADTGKPLPDAMLMINFDSANSAVTDANGNLQGRFSIPAQGEKFKNPYVQSAGYVDYQVPETAFAVASGTLDLGTIEMKSGRVVNGIMRMDGGGDSTRLPDFSLARDGKNEYLRLDSAGKFASDVLAPGSYQVELNSGSEKDWQLASPQTVVVPAAGAATAPVEIIVKRLTPFLPILKEVRGQLLDAQGRGIAGATVHARLQSEGDSYALSQSETTDSAGDFQFTSRRGNIVGVEWERAESFTYLIGGAPNIDIQNGIATVSGLTAKERGAIFAGRVLGADGKPAAGAWVTVVGAPDYAPVQSAADGTFKLLDVPVEQFTLLAAQNRDWAKEATPSDNSGVTLKLAAAPVAADRAAIEAQLVGIKDGVSWPDLISNWDLLGTLLIERFIQRNGPPKPAVLATFATELARRDPAQLLARVPKLLAATDMSTDGEARENLEAQLNLARAQAGGADDRALANSWIDAQKQIKHEINAQGVTRILQMAVVAQKLKRDDAAQLFDHAAAIAAQLGNNPGRQAEMWAASLVASGYDATTRLVEGWTAPAEFRLLAYVGPALAKSGDFAGARKVLARLEVLARDPEIANNKSVKTVEIWPGRADYARKEIVSTLAATDAPAALGLAEQIKNDYYRVLALVEVAAGAQKSGNAAVAEKALREVTVSTSASAENLAQAASIGARLSPQLGTELFALARKKALPDITERSKYSSPSIGAWAFYHAPLDAAQSRVLIEREWHWRLPAAIKNKDETFSEDSRALYQLVRGMTAIDADRARAMQVSAAGIGNRNYGDKISPFDIAVIELSNAK